jgi:hypothetical protein
MTRADDLRAAVEADDEATVLALLADQSEADRTGLQPVARVLVAAATKKGLEAVGHLGAVLLAAYGTLPVSDLRKLGWRSNHLPRRLEVVLERRAPERLVPIVEFLLDDVGDSAWRVVRPLVRGGSVPRPDRASYTIAMLAATRRTDAAELVEDDPTLLEVEVWRLFEVEGGGEDSLANHEKFFGDTWGNLFRDIAGRDPSMRRRLLDASLAALGRDFSTYRAGWFSRFHESVAPTDEERAQRVDAYLGLLRSRVRPTVTLAVAALERIQRAGSLSPEDVLDRIGPVLVDGAAGSARVGLGLVGRAGAGSPEHSRRAAIVATEALVNPAPDVQRAAIVLVDRLVHGGDEAVASAVADHLPDVAASQRAAAVGLVSRLGGAVAATRPARAGPVAPGPAPADPAGSAVPRPSPIDPGRAIEALSSIEALVDVAVSVLETGEPADDLERVLDAVGRLSGARLDHPVRLTAAIARRAATILARRESRPFTGIDARADVAAVLLSWTAGELVAPARISASADPGAGAFLSARARELAEAVADDRPFVGVSAPTHAGGWIDPAALVDRLDAHPPASTLDLVAAILRLAPDGREAARDTAAGLTGEAGSVVRYALGGQEQIGPTAAWWVAAARVRAPGQDDPAVEKRHPRLGPDAGLAARTRLTAREPRRSFAGLVLEIEPPLPAGVGVDLPTVLMLHSPSTFSWTRRSDSAMPRWIATIQPGDREAWSAAGSLLMARNVDWWSAEWANRVFLEPFIDPATSIGPHARTLLGIALAAKEAGERGLAADVVRLTLADGRLTGSTLGESLTAAATVGCDRPNRWARSLADVAGASDDHAAMVAEGIANSLPALAGRPQAKLVPLLRLLDELLADTGRPAVEAARPPLETLLSAGGDAGRLARSIVSRG